MTSQKTPLSARLNLFWANMLAPINAYLGTALIVLALAMALVGLSGGHMGGHVDISFMRDGGDVSVRMPENMMPDGQNHHGQNHYGQNQDSWHRDGHHDGHHGYGHHGRYMGGGHFGGGYFGWSAGLFGLVMAAGLAAMVGLVAQLIRIEGHLADWREGAVLAWVPVIIDKGRPRRINISLDAGLLETIDQETNRRGMTRSAFLSSAARREITQT